MTVNFLSEAVKARRQWHTHTIFFFNRIVNPEPRILYPRKISFRNKGRNRYCLWWKARRIPHRQICFKRNAKEGFLGRREMIAEKTLELQEWKNRNGKYLDKYKKIFFPLKFSKLCISVESKMYNTAWWEFIDIIHKPQLHHKVGEDKGYGGKICMFFSRW